MVLFLFFSFQIAHCIIELRENVLRTCVQVVYSEACAYLLCSNMRGRNLIPKFFFSSILLCKLPNWNSSVFFFHSLSLFRERETREKKKNARILSSNLFLWNTLREITPNEKKVLTAKVATYFFLFRLFFSLSWEKEYEILLLVERWISRFLASLKVAANCEMQVVWIARYIGPFRAAEHLTYWTYSTLCSFPFWVLQCAWLSVHCNLQISHLVFHARCLIHRFWNVTTFFAVCLFVSNELFHI